MFEMDGCQHHSMNLDKVISNSINLKMLININMNLGREIDGTHFIFEREEQILNKFKNERRDLASFKKLRSKKASILISINNKFQYFKYAEQCDQKWNLKNNKPSFIFLDNPQILD